MAEPNKETEEFTCHFHLQVDCHFFEYDLHFQQLRVCNSDTVELKDCFITGPIVRVLLCVICSCLLCPYLVCFLSSSDVIISLFLSSRVCLIVYDYPLYISPVF